MTDFTKYPLFAFIFALVLSLSVSTAQAQVQEQTQITENYRLVGKVVDANTGEALSDVEVKIKDPEHRTMEQTETETGREEESETTETTNDQGQFTFSELPSGEHTIKVDHEGYETWERNVNLNQDSQLTIELQPSR